MPATRSRVSEALWDARHLGAGDPSADGAAGHGAAAHFAVGRAFRADVDRLVAALAEIGAGVALQRRRAMTPSRRVGRRRPAAGAAARLGDALGAVGAGAAEARAALSRARGRPARARPQRADRADDARRDRRRGSRRISRRCPSALDGARLVARRRRRAALGAATRPDARRASWSSSATTPSLRRARRLAARDGAADACGASATSSRSSYRLTLQRFLTLQVQGSEHARELLGGDARRSSSRAASRRGEALEAALALLAAIDLRARVGAIDAAGAGHRGRSRHAGPAGRRRAGSPRRCRQAALAAIAGAAHVPFLSHPEAFVAASDGVPRWPMTRKLATDPRASIRARVRRAFERAAATYDSAAVLQREVGQRMAERLGIVQAAIPRRSSTPAAAPARRWANCARAIRARGWSGSTCAADAASRAAPRSRGAGGCASAAAAIARRVRGAGARAALRWSAATSAGCRSPRAASTWSGATWRCNGSTTCRARSPNSVAC